MGLKRQKYFGCGVALLLAFIPFLSYPSSQFGSDAMLKSTECSFSGIYTPNRQYDINAYLKSLEVKVVKPFLLQVKIFPTNLEAGNFIGISFYDFFDKVHIPIKDLDHTGTDEEVEASSFVQFKVFPGQGKNQLTISPVVFKKGYRGEKQGQEEYISPFGQENAIVDEKDDILGGEESFFTKVMVKVAGKGTYPAKNTQSYIKADKDGSYQFFIKLNPKFTKKLFLIAGITKISVFPSARGLRSPIITTPFVVDKSCG